MPSPIRLQGVIFKTIGERLIGEKAGYNKTKALIKL